MYASLAFLYIHDMTNLKKNVGYYQWLFQGAWLISWKNQAEDFKYLEHACSLVDCWWQIGIVDMYYICLTCGLGSFLVYMLLYNYSSKLCSCVIQQHVLTVVCATRTGLELQGTWTFLLLSVITLFLAVMILPFCDSRVLIPNTALDVGGSILKHSNC
jgi:hypothetical protein